MKLTTKLLFFNLVFGLFIGLLAGTWAYISLVDSVKSELGVGQQVRARETMDKIDRFLYERYMEVQKLANNFRFFIDDEDVLSAELKEIQLLSGTWDVIKVVDRSGVIISSINKDEKGVKLASKKEQELYEAAWLGEVVYSDIEYNNETSHGGMIWATPIKSSAENQREVIGVIIFELSGHILDEFLESSWGKEEGMYIIDSEGVVLASHSMLNDNELHHSYQIDQENWEAIKQAKKSLEIDGLFFEESSLIFSAAEAGYLDYRGNEWYLLSAIPIDLAQNRTTREMLIIFGSVGVISLLTIVGLMIFMNKVVIKPVAELTKVVLSMGKGEIDARAKVTTKDELGQMGAAFNILMDKLENSHKELENKVEERTERLTKTMNLMVGRELKMKQMKERIKELSK